MVDALGEICILFTLPLHTCVGTHQRELQKFNNATIKDSKISLARQNALVLIEPWLKTIFISCLGSFVISQCCEGRLKGFIQKAGRTTLPNKSSDFKLKSSSLILHMYIFKILKRIWKTPNILYHRNSSILSPVRIVKVVLREWLCILWAQ